MNTCNICSDNPRSRLLTNTTMIKSVCNVRRSCGTICMHRHCKCAFMVPYSSDAICGPLSSPRPGCGRVCLAGGGLAPRTHRTSTTARLNSNSALRGPTTALASASRPPTVQATRHAPRRANKCTRPRHMEHILSGRCRPAPRHHLRAAIKTMQRVSQITF